MKQSRRRAYVAQTAYFSEMERISREYEEKLVAIRREASARGNLGANSRGDGPTRISEFVAWTVSVHTDRHHTFGRARRSSRFC